MVLPLRVFAQFHVYKQGVRNLHAVSPGALHLVQTCPFSVFVSIPCFVSILCCALWDVRILQRPLGGLCHVLVPDLP